MTLAETASTFCETIATEAVLAHRITSYNVCYTKLLRRLGSDRFTEGGSGLRQRHRRELLQDGLIELVGAFVVESVTEFVRDGREQVLRAIEVDQDAALV